MRISSPFALKATVNGQPTTVDIDPGETLAEVLRERLGLTGTKISCDVEVCGACTVLVDGLPYSACTTLAYEVRDRQVTTIEGLAAPGAERLHPIQEAFLSEFAFQCGFCTPGMILAATSLLTRDLNVGDEQIIEYMDGNLCRCTGYEPILHAIKKAQAELRSAEA